MQAVAREMNFSESTFILPPESAVTDVRMRIFTPGNELPIAGHPTVGSTFALAHAGVISSGAARFVFGLGVGPTPVDLEWDGGRLRFVWMTQPNPVFDALLGDRAGAAAALSVTVDDLADALPVQQVSCGVPYVIVPMRTRDAVDRTEIDAAAARAFMRANPMNPDACVYVFSTSSDGDPRNIHARMFAPGFGITGGEAVLVARGEVLLD